MSRYLTPSKITLLILITIYCDSLIPSSSTIPVLSFIASYIIPGLQTDDDGETSSVKITSKILPSITEFENFLSKHSSAKPGRSLWHVLLERLWSLDSFHALHDFFGMLDSLLAPKSDEEDERPAAQIVLSRPSPLGVYVRRASLEFTRLQFHDAFRVWSAFLVFRQETSSFYKRRASNHVPLDENIDSMNLSSDDDLVRIAYRHLDDESIKEDFTSTDDIEKIIEFQLENLQRERTGRVIF